MHAETYKYIFVICAPIVSDCLYCHIKPGKGMSCFLVKKFVMDFG